MPSAQDLSRNPAQGKSLSKRDSRVSWGLILVGIILLILALLMFLYVKGYRPPQKKFVFEGRIERTPPTARAGNSPLLLMYSPDSLSPPKPGQSAEKREPISAPRILNHAQPVNRQTASGFSLTHTQSQSAAPTPSQEATPQSPQASLAAPTPERINQQKKPNVVRRFFRWLAGLFKGRKQERNLPNSPPVILAVTLSETTITLNCSQGLAPVGDGVFKGNQVQVRVAANDADGDQLRYKPSAQVGKLSGDKENIIWDLSGVAPGTYTLNVSAFDGKAESALYPVSLNILQLKCGSPCSYSVTVAAPATVISGTAVTFSSDVDYKGSSALNYEWTISPSTARIISGAGTPAITVDTTGLVAEPLTAILVVDDGSGERACRQAAQATTDVVNPPPPKGTTMIGKVVDAKGKAIPGATITLSGANISPQSRITNELGEYRFEGLPPGAYQVEVEVAGFAKKVWTISVRAGTNPTFQFPIGTNGTGDLIEPPDTPTGKAMPSPTPTPSPTPDTTSPPPLLKVSKQDEIRVYYPERFLKDTEGEVSFELEQVLRQVIASTTTSAEGKVEIISRPAPIAGVAAGTPLAEAFEGYEAYATVRLIPNGLVITSQPAQLEQPLNDQLVKWVWRLKPEGNDGTEASFRFELTVVWRAKNLPEKTVPNVWPHEPFKVLIGPPLTVKAAGYTAPVSLGGGAIALGLGVLQKRRRRLLGEEGEEEEEPLGMGDEGMAAQAEEPEEEVSSTVYAPTEAPPGDSFLVQVFVHLPEQAALLDELAKEADDAAKQRMTAKLKKKIRRGTELAFHLTMPGLEIDEAVQSCTWEGEPVWVQFGVTIPQERKPGNLIGTVVVSESSIPIGHLKFKFKITGTTPQETPAPVSEPLPAGSMVRYKQAFISYTSQDRAEVLKRVQMLNLVKVKFFQDLLTLEPGDSWEKMLYQYIDQSDVFYLFWSKAASESKWVRKEIEYAIKRKAGNEETSPEIVPVIIEGPPAARPPEDLSFLHFNDKFIYFISAEDADDN